MALSQGHFSNAPTFLGQVIFPQFCVSLTPTECLWRLAGTRAFSKLLLDMVFPDFAEKNWHMKVIPDSLFFLVLGSALIPPYKGCVENKGNSGTGLSGNKRMRKSINTPP